ncbi:MAG: hypothetical protein HOP11_06615 [Saprospiraceae bacterium]|nr:hypothetical protein [Saprospiraceae bacterium]
MTNKRNFLLTEFVSLLKTLDHKTKGEWGLMNPHQMVEHLTYSFMLANGKLKAEKLLSPEENIPKLQSWLLSPKLMKENIDNPLIPKTPPAPKHDNYQESIEKLYVEIQKMFEVYDQNPEVKILNPFYGDLDLEHNTNLLYKHCLHHLRQFGIQVEYVEG